MFTTHKEWGPVVNNSGVGGGVWDARGDVGAGFQVPWCVGRVETTQGR